MEYKVRFVGYKQQYKEIGNEIMDAVKRVMENGDFILRKDLEDFEKNIASFIGTKYAVGVNSGTDALYLSLIAAGIKPGDEVITVAHTFLATVGAIVNCRATPILIDVRDDFNIDVDQIENVITPKTKAILPVHLNGHLCEMDRIMEIAEKHDLLVIEDAAQALGAKFNDKKGGSFGLSGCFSFYPAKILGTAGDGGLVSTNDEDFAIRIRELRDNGRTSSGGVNGYGFCSRLDNLHAAILNVKLKHLPKWIERRREIARMYDKGLEGLSGLKQHPISDNRFFDVYQNYVIRSKKRDELREYLKKEGIETLISWPIPMHKHKSLNLSQFKLPKTEQISNEVLSLPMYPELSNEDVEVVIESIRKFHEN